MKKKLLIKVLLVIIVSVLFLIGLLSVRKKIVLQGEKISATSHMPSFWCYNSSGAPYFLADSSTAHKQYTLLAFMSVDCDHCQYMANSLVSNKNAFNNIAIFLIVTASDSDLNKFIIKNAFHKWPALKVLNDKKGNAFKALYVKIVPAFYMYENSHKQLVKEINGETRIENMLAVLK